MIITAEEAFKELNFGSVDAESEEDLSQKFLKTEDFASFVSDGTNLILGPKGSGKSALFELTTKSEYLARSWAPKELKNVLFVEATGFRDLSEIDTETIEELKKNPDFGYPKLWELYFSIKLASKLCSSGIKTKGASSELLKQIGKTPDYRLLPLAKGLWERLVGRVPKKISIPIIGEIQVGSSIAKVSTTDILSDIDKELGNKNLEAWLIFDKIDEIFPMSPDSRSEALAHLLQTSMECRKKYHRIKFKIFLRTDIWTHLRFTNKTHLLDKILELKWNPQKLRALLIKRATTNQAVRIYIEESLSIKIPDDIKELPADTQENIFNKIFEKQVYKGPKETDSLTWMTERATDSLDGVYPREMIMYGNTSKSCQTGPGSNALIDGNSIRDSYYKVSKDRCEGYLSEFPEYSKHFEKFGGKTSANFTRVELTEMFKELTPPADQAILELSTNIGILKPQNKEHAATAEKFKIPRLYIHGLGITTKGRP
jgi:hypothetical protein